MKTLFITLLFIFFNNVIIAQNINEYKYIIIPTNYNFLNSEDQYKLNSLTKFLFEKEGFITLYTNEDIPSDLYYNSCLALNTDVINKPGIFATLLQIELKNCENEIIFTSKVGKSKIKDYKRSYHEALRNAFNSIITLNYKYNKIEKPTITSVNNDKQNIKKNSITEKFVNNNTSKHNITLYAQKNENGFQLVDNTPKIIYTIIKSGKEDVFLLKNKKGILYKKNNRWFIEFYKNGKIILEQILIKF